ncbi:MAG: hypothetical protein WC421_08575 [Elusimicrobiales bacterium]
MRVKTLAAALALLSLLQIFGALWALRIYRGRVPGQDKVSLYLQKFDGIKPALADIRRAGYVAQPPDWAHRKLAQYALPSVALEENARTEYMVGNFSGPVRVPEGYETVAQTSGGAAVFRARGKSTHFAANKKPAALCR